MNSVGNSIATTISMIVVVLSLTVLSADTAIGKGNKRTGNPARFQQGTNLKGRDVRLAGTGSRALRESADTDSLTRNPKRFSVDIGTTEKLNTFGGNDTLKRRNVSPSGTGFKAGASGTPNWFMFHGTGGTGERFIRRTNPGLLGTGAGEIFF